MKPQVFLLVAIFAAASNADQINEIWVKTSDCQDCGMVGAVGKLSAKVNFEI